MLMALPREKRLSLDSTLFSEVLASFPAWKKFGVEFFLQSTGTSDGGDKAKEKAQYIRWNQMKHEWKKNANVKRVTDVGSGSSIFGSCIFSFYDFSFSL